MLELSIIDHQNQSHEITKTLRETQKKRVFENVNENEFRNGVKSESPWWLRENETRTHMNQTSWFFGAKIRQS